MMSRAGTTFDLEVRICTGQETKAHRLKTPAALH